MLNFDKLMSIYEDPTPNEYHECKWYYENGGPLKVKNGLTKLMKWVLKVKEFPELISHIEQLIKKDPSQIEKQNEIGWTALLMSVSMNNFSCTSFLLKSGANVNICDNKDKLTPLIIAICIGDLKLCKLLIRYGANFNHYDANGNNTLYFALMRNDYEILKFLFSLPTLNPSTLIVNKKGEKVVDFAFRNCCCKLIKLITIILYICDENRGIIHDKMLDHNRRCKEDCSLIKWYFRYTAKKEKERSHKKYTYNFCLQNIPEMSHKIKYKAGSYGSKIVNLHFALGFNFIVPDIIYHNEILKYNKGIVGYLGIQNPCDVKTKIDEFLILK